MLIYVLSIALGILPPLAWLSGYLIGKAKGIAAARRVYKQIEQQRERVRLRLQPPPRDDHWIVDKDGHCRLVDPRRGE